MPASIFASSTVRGRPRSLTSRQAVLAATLDTLATRGFDGLTIEGVAIKAGVGKATIYRWWPDRAALAVEAFFEATQDALVFPDTGNAREDFRLQVLVVAASLRGAVGGAMAGMVAGARGDPALARALGERWVAPRRAWGVARLERAIADGECAPGLDIDAALNAIYSPLYAPLLLGRGLPGDDRVEAYLDIVFSGVFGPSADASR